MSSRTDQLLRSIRQVNIFKNDSSNEHSTTIERISSWLCITLFMTIVASLAIFTALRTQVATVTISHPSRAEIEALQEANLMDLHCPCTVTSVRRSTFIDIKVTFHQICSSVFITDQWITASFSSDAPYLWSMDGRRLISSYGQGLRFLCETNQNSVHSLINNSLNVYMSSPEAQTTSDLNAIDATLRLFGDAAKRLEALSVIFANVVAGDMAISALGTGVVTFYSTGSYTRLGSGRNTYWRSGGPGCYCQPVYICPSHAAIYSTSPIRTFTTLIIDENATSIKGMYTDCYPFDGLLDSTLECYYDRSCLELFVSNTSTFTPLDANLPSRYELDINVNDLTNDAMIETLSQSVSPEAYQAQCKCQFCVYSYRHRSTFLTIITAIIGVVRTLDTVLRLLVPVVVRLVLKHWRRLCLRRPMRPRTTTSEMILARTFRQKLLELWKKITSLNLFNSNSNDVQVIDRERKITRLYVVLLILIMIILAFFVGLSQKITDKIFQHPSQMDHRNLQAMYTNKLRCPCAQARIQNRKFLQLNVTYHQVCSSDFAVDDAYAFQFDKFDVTNIHKYDFTFMTFSYFLYLNRFCYLVTSYADNAYSDYLKKEFVAAFVLSPDAFTAQIDSLIASTTRSIKLYINHTFQDLIEFSSKSYGLLNINTLSKTTLAADRSIQSENNDFLGCSCIIHPETCSTDAAFYNYTLSTDSLTTLFKVDGARLGCSPTRSTLQSSLACWYSRECYDQAVKFWKQRCRYYQFIPPLLNSSVDIHFKPSDTIMSIIQEAMIDRVWYNASYSSYFSECAAPNCTYSISEKQSFILIITNLMNISGGLTVALRLLTPVLFHLSHWLLGFAKGRVGPYRMIRGIPGQLLELNFFFDWRKSSSLTVRTERRATRLYIITWISVFTTLFLYNLFAEETNKIEVRQPTEAETTELFANHGTSLECPCFKTSQTAESFVDLSVRLHQVCSSPFVEDAWIENVFRKTNWSKLPLNQFRGFGVIYFVVQQSICRLAQRAADRFAVEFFNQVVFIEKLLSKDQLTSQIESVAEGVRSWNQEAFVTLLQFGRGGIQTNQLMNIFFSNWIYPPQNYDNLPNYLYVATPVSRGTACSCATSSACTEPLYIDAQILPGFVLGCNPIESLFRSTLSCLYNETCIQLVNLGNFSAVKPLDASLSNTSHPGDTVEKLVLDAFIDSWSMNISYSKFFAVCAPTSCTYSIYTRRPIEQVIIIVLGLYGGSTFILRLIIPRLTAASQKMLAALKRRNDRVIPFDEKSTKH